MLHNFTNVNELYNSVILDKGIMQLLVMLTFIFHGVKACKIQLTVVIMDEKYNVYFHLYVLYLCEI